MKRSSALAAALAVALLAIGPGIAGEKTATITGEVVDSSCYIKMGAKGADHAKCAADCGKAGVPLALLTDDGTLVWVASTKDMESANAMLQPYVAKKVTLEGQWFERSGTKLFAVSKITPAASK